MPDIKKSFPYVLITAICFGTMETALKLGGSTFDPIQLTFLRFFIGGVLLIPFAAADLKKRNYRLTAGDIIYLVILGLVCVCFSMTLFQIGVMKTNAALAALIISANPVFTMIFAHFLTSDKFNRKKLLVLLICIAGLVVAADPKKLLSGNNISGLLIVLVASIAFGLYTALGKKRIAKIGGWSQNCFSFLFGCAGLLIYLLVSGRPIVKGISLSSAPLLLYLGIVVTGIGYIAFLKAIAAGGPSAASVSFFIKPVIAMATAYIFLHEDVTPHMIAGAVLVICGSAINIIPFRSKHSSQALQAKA